MDEEKTKFSFVRYLFHGSIFFVLTCKLNICNVAKFMKPGKVYPKKKKMKNQSRAKKIIIQRWWSLALL